MALMSNRKDDVEDTVEEAPVEVQRIRKEMLAKIVGQGAWYCCGRWYCCEEG